MTECRYETITWAYAVTAQKALKRSLVNYPCQNLDDYTQKNEKILLSFNYKKKLL